jgi:hypothetical protein
VIVIIEKKATKFATEEEIIFALFIFTSIKDGAKVISINYITSISFIKKFSHFASIKK